MKKIPKKLERRLSRLLSAHTDAKYALHARAGIDACVTLEDQYHLFLSMVVCYCRPFTENQGLGSIIVDYPDFPDYSDDELNMAHERLMTVRHEFLSHSSAAGSKIFLVFPGGIHPATQRLVSRGSFAVAKRTFQHPAYTNWLAQAIAAFEKRLETDIYSILDDLSGKLPFGTVLELRTGAEDWTWDDK